MTQDTDEWKTRLMVFTWQDRKIAFLLGHFVAMQDHDEGGSTVWLSETGVPFHVDQKVDDFLDMIESGSLSTRLPTTR